MYPIEIIKHIYLSNYYNIKLDILIKLNIKAIINLSQIKFEYFNFEYLEINVFDDENSNISKFFHTTNKFIINNLIKNNNILIYCFEGKSRSPTIILAFLIKKRKYNYEDAINLIKSKTKIDINEGFINQLKNI